MKSRARDFKKDFDNWETGRINNIVQCGYYVKYERVLGVVMDIIQLFEEFPSGRRVKKSELGPKRGSNRDVESQLRKENFLNFCFSLQNGMEPKQGLDK